MACFHPLKVRYRTSLEQKNLPSGKTPNSLIFSHGEHELYPGVLDEETGQFCEWFDIPCGKCIGCRLAYSREWANRNVLEALCYEESSNYFITLTYDDLHVPVSEISGCLTTQLDDVSAFMKRLRRYYEYTYNHKNIRFYAASEYGCSTFRPHYHVSLFNCPIFDLKKLAVNFRGDVLYTSETIEKLWSHGFVVIGEFAWNTAAYTARYMVKKLKGDAALEYQALGIQPESTRMSRAPGIGVPWIEKVGSWDQIYAHDEIVLPSNGSKVNAVKPPKIFDKMYAKDHEVDFAKVKSMRQRAADISLAVKLDQTGYTKKEYFAVAESYQKRSSKQLKRIFQDLS